MGRIPEHIGPLVLKEQLGVGRQCEIWSAVDTAADGVGRAVKVAVPEASRDASLRRLLRHEARVGAALDHPGLVRVHRFAVDAGLPYVVMELFPHANLKRQLAGGPEPLTPRVGRIMTETALALDHLHGRGWVHRDIKPENVLADSEGRVKMIDYALATRRPGLLARLVGRRGQAAGSPSYMSPEQIRGYPVDARSDVYSLGCLYFELLAGRPPFTAASQNDLLGKHIAMPAPAVEATRPGVGRGFSALLREMLAKKPERRPATAREVLKRLQAERLFA
jgi:serine/threonine protein kinase